jgi:glycosyltransferase involved in cell wall biosynthesis
MRIAVLNTSVPFLRGGAEHLADALEHQLTIRGHEVEHIKIPLRWGSPLEVSQSMFAAATLRVADADRVIALKFPAYLVPHPNKVIWLMHQFRQVYDFWGTPLQDIPASADGLQLRRSVRIADDIAFAEAKAILCNSPVTAKRLSRFNGVNAEVLLAPLADTSAFRHEGYGDYLLALGRINASKRQHLLAAAMAHTRSPARLIIAGSPEMESDLTVLTDLIQEHDLSAKVTVIARFISEDEKVKLLSNARAVAYLPVDEDSYGYVTAEAMLSAKSVLTSDDSGGVLSLVESGVTGLVSNADARSLAIEIDRYWTEPDLAARLGAGAANRIDDLGLSWSATIEKLLS